jgi:outer membrane protein assembly factor BamA
MPHARLLAWLLLGLAPLAAGAQEKPPSFDELEAAGALIGEIRVETDDIFDLADPHENKYLYRLANRLHITTRPWVIRRMLLFRSGDVLSHRVIDETERVIRGSASVYDVSIRPVRYHDGVVDLLVRTRDTWTLDPSVHLSRTGGANTGGFSLKEGNLAGTGTMLEVERSKDIERTGSHLRLGHEHLFGGWTRLAFDRASFSDGSSLSLDAARPFYSLDTRWAAGSSYSKFERTDSLYRNGNVVGEYRHTQHAMGAFAGWSAGRVGRWTQRYTVALNYAEDTYRPSATQPPLLPIPADRTIAGPSLRYDVIEEDYLEVTNRERIQRPEYLAMGWQSSVQIGRSLAAFGATEQPWQLGASVSKGFRGHDDAQLLTSASYSAQYGSVTGDVRSLGAAARYYKPQRGSFLLFLSGSVATVKTASAADEMLLGGDSGLRGYPLRYQSGTRRALFTAEERYYTDWYPFRLFRVGWAVYYDVGRAWGGRVENATPGWLSNVGFGLRILNARASFGNVVHIDLAFPVNRSDPNIKARQFVVQTEASF